jgi:hypothetical protein
MTAAVLAAVFTGSAVLAQEVTSSDKKFLDD